MKLERKLRKRLRQKICMLNRCRNLLKFDILILHQFTIIVNSKINVLGSRMMFFRKTELNNCAVILINERRFWLRKSKFIENVPKRTRFLTGRRNRKNFCFSSGQSYQRLSFAFPRNSGTNENKDKSSCAATCKKTIGKWSIRITKQTRKRIWNLGAIVTNTLSTCVFTSTYFYGISTAKTSLNDYSRNAYASKGYKKEARRLLKSITIYVNRHTFTQDFYISHSSPFLVKDSGKLSHLFSKDYFYEKVRFQFLLSGRTVLSAVTVLV